MIKNTDNVITVSNKSLKIVADYNSGLKFSLYHLHRNKIANLDREAFNLEMHGKKFTSKNFKMVDVITAKDEAQELVTFLLENKKEAFKVRISLINDLKETINVLYQIWDDYLLGAPSVVKIHIPLLAELNAGKKDRKYYPSMSIKTKKGTNALIPVMESFYSTDVLLPLVVADEDDKYGYSLEFPTASDLSDTGATQNVNKILTGISSYEELKEHKVQINPDSSFNDTIELKITALTNGWVEAFDRYRDTWQENYDFSEYHRKDLQWFNTCVINNFTFLYGQESMDHEKKKIDVESMVKQGEEFGGYDTVCIWNMYPRLGVDFHDQWDFYDLFPGGRKAIKKAVEEFHSHGIKVLLPYIPWDQSPKMSVEDMGDELAKIIKDTDADGFQFDTLRDIPFSFRTKLDKVKPGILLQTQHHPIKKHPTEFITSSWDELWRTDPMPEADVFRFICPIHPAPVIDRWLRLEDKDTLIKRVMFGGTTFVIWQDIFGRWMPFTKEQKAKIKAWKKVYLENYDVFMGKKPTPYAPTFKKDLYCNIFRSDDGKKQIYAFYNDSNKTVNVKNFVLENKFKNAKVIVGDSEIKLNGNKLNHSIKPREVVEILVK
jgi:hypothetical protein